MRRLTKTRASAYLALIFNALLWGLALPIVKKGYQYGLTPNSFLIGHMLFALVFSLPLVFYIRRRTTVRATLKFKNIAKVIPLELLGTVLTLLLLYEGVRLTTAVESSLISMTTPIFITLGGIFFLKEKEQKNEWAGLLLALVGTFLLVVKPLLNLGVNGSTYGNLLIIGQNLTITTYYLIAKKVYKNLDKLTITHLSFWTGLTSFSLISIYSGISPITAIDSLFSLSSPWPLAAVLYMAIPGSILALTLYLQGQDKIEASEASLFTYLQPMFAIPASIILLSESVSLIEITATAIIIAGVYLAEKRG